MRINEGRKAEGFRCSGGKRMYAREDILLMNCNLLGIKEFTLLGHLDLLKYVEYLHFPQNFCSI